MDSQTPSFPSVIQPGSFLPSASVPSEFPPPVRTRRDVGTSNPQRLHLTSTRQRLCGRRTSLSSSGVQEFCPIGSRERVEGLGLLATVQDRPRRGQSQAKAKPSLSPVSGRPQRIDRERPDPAARTHWEAKPRSASLPLRACWAGIERGIEACGTSANGLSTQTLLVGHLNTWPGQDEDGVSWKRGLHHDGGVDFEEGSPSSTSCPRFQLPLAGQVAAHARLRANGTRLHGSTAWLLRS